MYSEDKAGKASKGSVRIKTSNNRLQLVFTFGGKRHYLSTGYPDTTQYRKLAQMRATEIEKDILYERFDPTLEKYKPQSALSTVTPVTPISTPKLTLAELWEKFVEWKRPQCAPSTMKNQYRAFTSYLKRMPSQDLDHAIEIRDEALQSIPINSAKRFITALNACCDWSIQSGLMAVARAIRT